jgi:hypothetical protein
MTGCYISLQDPLEPVIRTEPGKITADNYWDFGKIIATDGDHLLVSSHKDIHIFKYNSSGIELIQTIGFEETFRIISMVVYRSELIMGVEDLDGTGTVYVYERSVDAWKLNQVIRIGRPHDCFGCAIDMDGETMVIGANSFRSDCITEDECGGRLYVFQKREGVWEETQEIVADQTGTGDWFGTCVGIYGDLMLAGSPTLPLHVYKFNGEWELLRTEEISVRTIAHFGNNFMVNGDDDFRAFILEPDGSFSENTIRIFNDHNISWSGENIEIRDSLAIINLVSSGCYLFKYGNRQWNKEIVFYPDPGETCTFDGMAITDHYVILGGMNNGGNQCGYVYFRDL